MPVSACSGVFMAVAALLAVIALGAGPVSARSAAGGYALVSGWPQGLPSNATRFTAAAVVQDTVFVAQRGTAFPQPLMTFDRTSGALTGSFGRAVVAGSTTAGFGVHGMNAALVSSGHAQLFVTDVLNHTVSVLTLDGQLQAQVGTPGLAGSGTAPLQFGSVADVDFDVMGGVAYVSDGDGGVNARVLALDMNNALHLRWVVGSNGSAPGQFSSPHTVTYHQGSDTILVGDRGNARIQQLAAADGRVIDVWTCIQPARPWGLRYVYQHDVLLMADGDDQVGGEYYETKGSLFGRDEKEVKKRSGTHIGLVEMRRCRRDVRDRSGRNELNRTG